MLYYNQGKGNKTKQGENKMKKAIEKMVNTTLAIVGITMVLWIGLSWIDIIVDNTTTANHHPLNAFVLLAESAK